MLHDMTDNADVQAAYAWALYNLDDAVGALAQLDTLLATQPDHPRSLFYKGRILLDQGDLDGARSILEKVAATESPFRQEAAQLLNVLAGDS
jgi:FimV-like protein